MPDGGKEFRPVHRIDNGAWAIGDPPGFLQLYCCDDLPPDGPIIVVEGEQCVDLARELGFAAFTSAHGSNGATKTDWTPLKGRDVWILPDNDTAGERYGREVAGILSALACRVKIVRLPNLPPKGDIVDFDQVIADTPEATTAEIIRLAREAEIFHLPPSEIEPTNTSPQNVFSPGDPLPIARTYRTHQFQHADGPTLYFSGGTFQHYDGAKYVELGNDAIRAGMYAFLDRAQKLVTLGKEQELKPFAPNIASVSNAVDALKALAFTDAQMPSWLADDPSLPDPAEILAMANGLVRLRQDEPPELFRAPTPLWFSPNAVDYEFIAGASTPAEWLKFLNILWPDDGESIKLLQEWFGYVLTADTRQQKILLLIGPPRSGKGTIARVLSHMIGLINVCAPTLAGLATNFGLWSLIGKLVAIISDARLSGRTDQAIVTERLLSISGEDYRVKGDGLRSECIPNDSILVVDRAVDPRPGCLVVTEDGDAFIINKFVPGVPVVLCGVVVAIVVRL